MPSLTDRLPLNVAGKYYVDSSCIDCDLCRTTAPDLFGRDDESAMSYVKKQPENAEEGALMEQAVGDCATNSIGNDAE
ncbi:MAG TPA: ferredoxin [Opitutus sp.]|nr:ferredoxin [Opitutus sp.]